eukprot:5321287-Lingulodinium_polyedra.AAC.1
MERASVWFASRCNSEPLIRLRRRAACAITLSNVAAGNRCNVVYFVMHARVITWWRAFGAWRVGI